MPNIPDVTIHIRQNYPLNRQLDASAGQLVLKKIEGMGVNVTTRSRLSGITTRQDEEGKEVFTGFITPDGPVEADMAIFAIGIKPRDDLAIASGIEVAKGGGVKVGDDLMSSAQDVYAIGECASWQDHVC